MTLFTTVQSAPFKTLTLLIFAFLLACNPKEDDGFTPPDPTPDPDPVWNVAACAELSHTTVVVGEALQMTSCNEAVATYSWTINGQQVGTSETDSWVFESPGNYIIELTIGNGEGQTTTTEQSLTVQPATEQFAALSIPNGAVRRSVGMQMNGQNDLFLITENKDQDDLVLMNFDANLNLNWQKPLAALNWAANVTSMAKLNQGWLINSTESVGDNAYLSKWITTDDKGNFTSQDLNSVFYKKVISLSNNEFVAIGYRLTILDDGAQGTQAILDHYDGDLTLIKSIKLLDKSASSFAGAFYMEGNNSYHAVSYAEQTNGKWKAHYSFLSELNIAPTAIPWPIEVDNMPQVKNMNTEVLVAGAEEIFVTANNNLFMVSNGNEVKSLPYTGVEKIQNWQDKVFVMTNEQIVLLSDVGDFKWQRHLVSGASMGAVLLNSSMYFDRTVPLNNAEQENNIYIGSINSEGVFGDY